MVGRTLLLSLAFAALAQARMLPKADCTWSTNTDLPSVQPLYIKPGAGLDINSFWLPQNGDIVTVPEAGEVLFACPGSTLAGVGGSEALLTCVGGKTFADSNNNQYSFSSLSCSSWPAHTAVRRNGEQCQISLPHSLVEIGFELSSGFFHLITVCFDEVTYNTYQSFFTQTADIDGYQSGLNRPSFTEGVGFYPDWLDVDYQYSRVGQKEAISQALGSAALADQYIPDTGNYFLSRGHLAANADFVYGAFQRSTFYFLNVAPQWQTFNGANWAQIEDSARDFAALQGNDLVVYTGTHGVTTLPDVNGNPAEIFVGYDLNTGAGILRVPHFFWKIVYEPATQKGVAFVGLNNPYIDSPGTDFYMCPDVCDQISWENWSPTVQQSGYGYCCDVNTIKGLVPEMPDIVVTGLLA
ncbi:uncharacterized protein LOC132199336 [Neocloeon triangulifer]|uniref:uncharacterized protein LOC132199336 n=1 Tax=Neocloeon triangulifer TaxID=2078957 RepID=UPI00286F71A1|nr:uncharacterized protein LOC132199336 [Neocloeon triangulifer]